ncbi:hypothetical protein [Streptomyces sp. NPDC101132]
MGAIADLALCFTEHALFTTVEDKGFGPVHPALPDLTTLRPVLRRA